MILLRLSGGLGNQMFEYALYIALKARGKTVKIDDVSDYMAADRRSVQLNIFDAPYERASREEIIRYTDASMAFRDRVRRKLTGRKSLAYREMEMAYDPSVFQRDPVYLEGYFQSERYFADVKDEVRRRFRFRFDQQERQDARNGSGIWQSGPGTLQDGPGSSQGHPGILPNGPGQALPEYCRSCLEQIRLGQSVAVHVRRGDYLDPKHGGIYEGICTREYYEEAMGRIRERWPDARFFLFSNDPDWTRRNLGGEGRILVEGGSEETGYLDLYLMSQCRHAVIANSSFSWWGAWLIENPQKMVIAPSRWMNGRDCRDIYTEDMIRI